MMRYVIRPVASLQELAQVFELAGAQLPQRLTRHDRRLAELARRFPADRTLMLVAEHDGERAGFALVRVEAGELEVLALRSLREREGVGTALLSTLEVEARRAGCRRVWLVTTNDNLDAIRFYQRRGWRWVAFHRDAVIEARKLKPEIAELGAYGIPIRHELEFEAPTA